jgi:hypothetical protein
MRIPSTSRYGCNNYVLDPLLVTSVYEGGQRILDASIYNPHKDLRVTLNTGLASILIMHRMFMRNAGVHQTLVPVKRNTLLFVSSVLQHLGLRDTHFESKLWVDFAERMQPTARILSAFRESEVSSHQDHVP